LYEAVWIKVNIALKEGEVLSHKYWSSRDNCMSGGETTIFHYPGITM
jgi:hypothetical protein